MYDTNIPDDKDEVPESQPKTEPTPDALKIGDDTKTAAPLAPPAAPIALSPIQNKVQELAVAEAQAATAKAVAARKELDLLVQAEVNCRLAAKATGKIFVFWIMRSGLGGSMLHKFHTQYIHILLGGGKRTHSPESDRADEDLVPRQPIKKKAEDKLVPKNRKSASTIIKGSQLAVTNRR